MRQRHTQIFAHALFALGFILTSSGWSGVVSLLINGSNTPSWSVCGMDMCSCAKPLDNLPGCPLCESGLMDPDEYEGCSKGSEKPQRPLPTSLKSFDALNGASAQMIVAMFVTTWITRSDTIELKPFNLHARLLQDDPIPDSRHIGVPTPPPRA